MNICLAQKNDALEIARIHKTEISQGFLSSLPIPFLEKLYAAIIEFDGGVCVVAEENGKVVGFIAGTTSVKKFYTFFLKRYFFHSIYILFLKLFNFQQLKKIVEILFYPIKEGKLPEAELLTMAVAKEFQGKGIAGQMFGEFVKGMKGADIKEFKVLVGEDLALAIKFYEKTGFTFLTDIIIHGNKITRVYVYNILE